MTHKAKAAGSHSTVTAGLETTIGAPLHHAVQQQVDYIHYKLHKGTSFEAIEKFYMVSVD